MYKSIFFRLEKIKKKKENRPFIIYYTDVYYKEIGRLSFALSKISQRSANLTRGKTPQKFLPGARFLKNAPAKRPAPAWVFAFRLS